MLVMRVLVGIQVNENSIYLQPKLVLQNIGCSEWQVQMRIKSLFLKLVSALAREDMILLNYPLFRRV